MNTDYSPLPQNRSTRHQPKKDNAIIFCIRIAEQCTSYLSPDITGSFGITGNDADRGFSTSYTDGCFTTKSTTLGGLDSGASSYRTGIPYFVASRVSGIFGRSYGVSVDAVYALIIIKV